MVHFELLAYVAHGTPPDSHSGTVEHSMSDTGNGSQFLDQQGFWVPAVCNYDMSFFCPRCGQGHVLPGWCAQWPATVACALLEPSHEGCSLPLTLHIVRGETPGWWPCCGPWESAGMIHDKWCEHWWSLCSHRTTANVCNGNMHSISHKSCK